LEFFESERIFILLRTEFYRKEEILDNYFEKKQKIVKKIIGSQLGIKFTLFGVQKGPPFKLTDIENCLSEIKGLNENIRFSKNALKEISNINDKLVFGINDKNRNEYELFGKMWKRIYRFSEREFAKNYEDDTTEEPIWGNLLRYFSKYFNDLNVQKLKNLYRRAFDGDINFIR
jgi:hypothetical protein